MHLNGLEAPMKRFIVHAAFLIVVCSVAGLAALLQSSAPLTNNDVMDLKRAGVSDDVIILKIRGGPTKFETNASDLIALKNAGVSDAVVAEMLKSPPAKVRTYSSKGTTADLSHAAIILPFDSSVNGAEAAGLPDATRTAVIQVLENSRMFSAVVTPEEALGRTARTEITATLVDFAPGNVATRIIVGLGTGRAHAGFNFSVKDTATGKVVWKKTVKETASFWSNSASSSAQRQELPEKVAKAFVEELKKAKLSFLQ